MTNVPNIISDDFLRIIEEAGYQYDSSYNSFGMHGRYGKISSNGKPRKGIAILLTQQSPNENRKFYELPISNLTVRKPFSSKPFDPAPCSVLPAPCSEQSEGRFVLPWGGGAYFRLIPGPVFRMGVREILKQQQGYVFYMHPWEVDPDQPRPEGTKAFSRFKHYTNLSRTEVKLKSLLQEFQECSFVTCHEYLERDGLE